MNDNETHAHSILKIILKGKTAKQWQKKRMMEKFVGDLRNSVNRKVNRWHGHKVATNTKQLFDFNLCVVYLFKMSEGPPPSHNLCKITNKIISCQKRS